MRLILRCVILATVLTFVLEGVILLTGSKVAWFLLYPAVRGTAWAFDSHLGSSDSGLNNLIELLLASSVLNVFLYTAALFALFKILLWAGERCVVRRLKYPIKY